MSSLRWIAVPVLMILGAAACAETPVASGVAVGKRPGPYSSLVTVGTNRGKLHCFVCEAEDRPVVVVFARQLDESIGKLARQLDKALGDYKKEDLRTWITFLSDDQTTLDPKVVAWSRKYAIRNLPVSIFEDLDGPPSYKLSRDAEVTILLSVKQKVQKNFAFRRRIESEEDGGGA